MIPAHLPALQVVIPLLSAPVCAVLGRGVFAWVVTMIVAWVAFFIAAALLFEVVANGPVSYEMARAASRR